jgi:hypothetical protein
MEENNGKKGRYQRKEIAKTPLKGHKKAIDKNDEINFMKIREGESIEQWESRTQKLRILPEKEHEKKQYTYKTRKNQKSSTAKYIFTNWEERLLKGEVSKSEQIVYKRMIAKKKRLGLVLYQANRDPLLHFKYYFVISRYLEVRYNLKPQEVSFIIHLYCIDRPFLKREFDEKSMIVSGATFKKYMSLGIIRRLKYREALNNYLKTGYSPYYSLTNKASTHIGKAMTNMLLGGDFNPKGSWYRRMDDKKEKEFKIVVDLYYDLRQEVKNIEQGIISDDRFYPIGLNTDELINPLGDGVINV